MQPAFHLGRPGTVRTQDWAPSADIVDCNSATEVYLPVERLVGPVAAVLAELLCRGIPKRRSRIDGPPGNAERRRLPRGAYNEQRFRKRFHETRAWMMADLTLETLATRLANLERKVAELSAAAPAKDWRRTVGMFEGSAFMAEVDAEVLAQREAERLAARAGNDEGSSSTRTT